VERPLGAEVPLPQELKENNMLALKDRKAERAYRRSVRRFYANDNDALIPELWAKYTLAILESNMVAGQLVYRDFEASLANFGDTVNTRKPAEMTVSRKTDADSITAQDASVTNIPVKLDMHPYVSFIIKDGEESMSMQSLVDLHLEPAVKALAEHIDSCILGQYPQFLTNAGVGGKLGGMTSSNYQQYLAELGEALDVAKCPADGRNLVLSPAMKRLFLQNQPLVGADQRGDAGTALRTASMGMVYGFDHFMCQNMRSVAAADVTSSAFLVNNAAGYNKGDTTLAVDTGTGSIADGVWLTILGKPYRIISATDTLGNTTSIEVSPALRETVPDNTPITFYDPGAVNNAAGYAAGWQKAIVYDGTTIQPKVGQFVSFKASGTGAVYTIVKATSTEITLDRPLEASIADNDPINLGPPGNYGLAFRREAIALVVRPLKLPRVGAGALAGALNHNGFSLRVVIAYDYEKQGHAVTIDCLMGIKVLDNNYGAVLLG
jgi:hypothetical protein